MDKTELLPNQNKELNTGFSRRMNKIKANNFWFVHIFSIQIKTIRRKKVKKKSQVMCVYIYYKNCLLARESRRITVWNEIDTQHIRENGLDCLH